MHFEIYLFIFPILFPLTVLAFEIYFQNATD